MRPAIIIALALVLALWSAATIAVDSFYTKPYRDVAEQLETGRAAAPDGEFFERVKQSLGSDRILSLCLRDIVRSAVTIELATLEAAYRQQVQTGLDAALGHARTTLTQALGCLPNDGNFWLRLAIVDFAAKGTLANVEEELMRSRTSAPSEAWIMMPRLAFAAQIRDTVAPGIQNVMQSDARNLVTYAQEWALAYFYVHTNSLARKALDEQISSAGQERSALLRRAITTIAESKTRK